MAYVIFRIHYATQWGDNVFLERLAPQGRKVVRPKLWPMQHEDDGFWSLQLDTRTTGVRFRYRYRFRGRDQDERREPVFRRLNIASTNQVIWDHWLAPELPDAPLLRQAFPGIIFNPTRTNHVRTQFAGGRLLRLTLRAPRVAAGHRLCVLGSHPLLGLWNPTHAWIMSSYHYPLWELELPAAAFSEPVEFKFGLWDERLARMIDFEDGANRRLSAIPSEPDVIVVNYENFGHKHLWRGAGVAIPVFALRSERGYGIGEFADLAPFAKWAAQCHLHLVQVLPVNDTSSDFTWKDSYPYKAISTGALHPIYINIERLFGRYGVPLTRKYFERRSQLNRRPQIDYERVLKEKLDYLRQLFDRVGMQAMRNPEIQTYCSTQSHWLLPYAGFCVLRDLHGTADFTQWGDHATYCAKDLRQHFGLGDSGRAARDFYCWVQYHLDQQLAEARAAGHACGVAFKGDLPIGIDRSSVEAWTEPELFQMDRQTGAPPDAFAVLGQNWGFPTYNWPRMEADGYAWWQRRFHRMAAAFDALRIDHILGFFRIWEIPQQYGEGIMGHYRPALPLSRDEIAQAGFPHDPRRFGVRKGSKGLLLKSSSYEVLFLEDPDQPDRFHPRINLEDTTLFRSLPEREQAALRQLHDDYYYRRHTQFWADEAMKKLPALMDASPMLICGEDLGMVPDSVPMVLKRLGLLSLEVQRWPKTLGQRLGNPAEYPYLSVCTTSTHDMSTIRGWWEEEPETRQHFWTEVMKREGTAPSKCSIDICQFIVAQNLAAASMWCVLPLQDWLGIDADLRHPIAAQERINVPAIPRHYWCYRMHLTIEALLAAEEFNGSVARMVEAAGRNQSD